MLTVVISQTSSSRVIMASDHGETHNETRKKSDQM